MQSSVPGVLGVVVCLFVSGLQSFNSLHFFLTKNMEKLLQAYKILLFIFCKLERRLLAASSVLMLMFINCSYGKESSLVLMQMVWQMSDTT